MGLHKIPEEWLAPLYSMVTLPTVISDKPFDRGLLLMTKHLLIFESIQYTIINHTRIPL